MGARRSPPPPRPQDYAVAMMNHLLDGGQIRREEEEESDDEVDANIDPQLRAQPQAQAPARKSLMFLNSPMLRLFQQLKLWFRSLLGTILSIKSTFHLTSHGTTFLTEFMLR